MTLFLGWDFSFDFDTISIGILFELFSDFIGDFYDGSIIVGERRISLNGIGGLECLLIVL